VGHVGCENSITLPEQDIDRVRQSVTRGLLPIVEGTAMAVLQDDELSILSFWQKVVSCIFLAGFHPDG
jgi:hypothetical protein